MKKPLLFWKSILGIFGFLLLQSCSINTTNHYHSDKKISFATDVDMREAMEMMKSFMPDSLSQGSDFMKSDKYPRDWKNLYEIQKEEGKVSTNPDSIKILKKLFFKGNFTEDNFKGFSVKSDPLTREELASVGTLMGKESSMVHNSAFEDWNGNILKIDMKKLQLSSDELKGIFKTGDKEKAEDEEGMEQFLSMMEMRINNKLVFDKKIKSVKGKHDWIKQLDNKTMEVNLDLKEMTNKDHKFTNQDAFIIIETE